MDVHDKLDQITTEVEQARAMPMSASAIVNRADLLGLLGELRELLPTQLHDAGVLLEDRDAVLEQGRAQAQALLAAAQVEHDRLVEASEVTAAARARGAEVQLVAQAEAQRLMTSADEYVEAKLAAFEASLAQLTQQVRRGRERLAQRQPGDPADS